MDSMGNKNGKREVGGGSLYHFWNKGWLDSFLENLCPIDTLEKGMLFDILPHQPRIGILIQ